jgi:putative nucleotidyltransferase with HDIG domain
MTTEPDSAASSRIDFADAVDALVQTLIVWDEDAYEHCRRTAEYAEAIGREMGIPHDELALIRTGSLLHDIGQMGVSLAILRKPGVLDEHEQERVRLHPLMGASILERVLPSSIVECAAAHHEQPDGLGYPRGLREAEIPRSALICRVADVLDSLTTVQSYRPALTLEAAVDELRDGAGTRYSASVVDALMRLLDSSRGALAA